MDEFLYQELGSEHARNPELLVEPLEQVMGPEPDLSTKKVEVRLGRRPIAHGLRALYEASGRAYPATLKLDSAYRLWLISVSAGVLRHDGFEDVKYLSLEIRFPEEPRLTVQGLAPQTHLIDRLKVDSETRFSVGAEVRANGDIALPEIAGETMREATGFSIGGAAGAKIHASTQTDVVGHLSFSVASPVVQSIGIGDHRCEWEIKRHDKALVGDHIFMVTLLVPALIEKVTFEARVGVTVTTFDFLKDTLEGAWVNLEASVPRDAAALRPAVA